MGVGGWKMHTWVVSLFIIFNSFNASASRPQFVGTWINNNNSSPHTLIRISSDFSINVTGLGSGHLVTYGLGIGHPNAHNYATAILDNGSQTITVILWLGSMLNPDKPHDKLDFIHFTDKGYSLDYGNTGGFSRFSKRIIIFKPEGRLR